MKAGKKRFRRVRPRHSQVNQKASLPAATWVEVVKIVPGGYGLAYPQTREIVDDSAADHVLGNKVGIATRNKLTWLVQKVLPGEVVLAEPVARQGRTVFAVASQVKNPSSDRQLPVWEQLTELNSPGAFDFAHIKPSAQQKLKGQILVDALSRLGGAELLAQVKSIVNPVLVQAVPGERLRADFPLLAPGKIALTGFRTDRLYPVQDFPYASTQIRDGEPASAAWQKRWAEILTRPVEQTWQTERRGRSASATARSGSGTGNETVSCPRVRFWQTALGMRMWDGQYLWSDPETICGLEAEWQQITSYFPEYAAESAPDFPVVVQAVPSEGGFVVPAAGFWQAHEGAAEVLSQALRQALQASSLKEKLSEPKVLELYAGAGLFTRVLGQYFWGSDSILNSDNAATAGLNVTAASKLGEDISQTGNRPTGGELVSVEYAGLSVQAAEINLRAAFGTGKFYRIEAGNVDRQLPSFWWSQTAGRPDLAVVDPPRSGISRPVLEDLVGLAPKVLVYVACDVAAFSRDAARLVAAGYRLKTFEAFDLFPNTHHFEIVASFVLPR